MKQTLFLIVSPQTGQSRLRRTPSAGATEYVFQIDLEIPENPIPVVTITIPVPAAPAVVTRVESIPFGVPWAISEGLIEVKGLTPKGEVILDYTDTGLERLYKEAGGEERELVPYNLIQYAKKNWGLPVICIEPARWDGLVGKGDEGE